MSTATLRPSFLPHPGDSLLDVGQSTGEELGNLKPSLVPILQSLERMAKESETQFPFLDDEPQCPEEPRELFLCVYDWPPIFHLHHSLHLLG